MNTFMCTAVFEEDIMDALHSDIMLIASPKMCRSFYRGTGNEAFWKPQPMFGSTVLVPDSDQFTVTDKGDIIWNTLFDFVCPNGSFFFDSPHTESLDMDLDHISPDDYHPQDDYTDDFLRKLEETARICSETTDRALCLGESITDLQVAPAGPVGTMMLMAEDPDRMKEFLEKALLASQRQLKLLEQAVGKYVDILCIAHDFGDNQRVTIGEELWRSLYKPYYKRLFEFWHNHTSMKVNMHSCGAIEPIIEDLIECGVDILNPVQISAHGMQPSVLKEKYGSRLVFWGGGYDAQKFRPQASYDEVYQASCENIRQLSAGGGYIFAGVHNLPPEMPAHHIAALLDAYNDCHGGM